MEDKTLAMELLHEVKQTSKRWFIAFCIMVALEIATIIGFVWYISLPVEEYSIEQEADNNSYNNAAGGNIYNGSETESDVQKTDDTK